MQSVLPMTESRLLPKAVVHPVPRTTPAPPRARVSVIIPNYNYGRYLGAAAASALGQQDVDVEVIIIDNASTDDSAKVASAVGADPRVRLVLRDVNIGHVASVNEGLEMATGEFLCRLDADDLLTPGSLARSVALMREFESVGLVYGYPRHFYGEPPASINTGPVRSWTIWSGPDWVLERCRTGYNCITTPEVLLRTEVLRRVGGIDTRMSVAEDLQWWLRIAANCDVGRISGPDQALHREHNASMTATVDKLADLKVRVLAFRYFIEAVGSTMPNAEQADLAWRTALADEALDEACRAYDRGRTERVDVEGYLAVARDLLPEGYEQRPLWRAHQRRVRVGPELAPFTPFAAAAIARRRISHVRRYRRWQRAGL